VDVKRRLPYYWSDITNAFTQRTIASMIRMYFVAVAIPVGFLLMLPF
jgi:TRAP-type C4-dicarboxylate transport system permease small subunit